MCRTFLHTILVTSFATLSVTVGACATGASDEDLIGPTQQQNPTNATGATNATDEQTSKLPASSPPPSDEKPNDPNAPPAKDPETPPAKDPETPPTSPTPPTNTEECDPNNETYAKAFIKALSSPNATPCPCSASECCYSAFIAGGGLCVPK